MSDEVRMVMCRKLGEMLPGLKRPPYRNELGQRLFEDVSQKAWDGWLRDSVKLVNTYKPDLATVAGTRFMMDQCEIYFGYKDGDLAATAWTPPTQ